MSIVTAEAVESYYRSEITADRALVEVACLAVTSVIEQMCQRQFAVAGSATARTYVPRPQSTVLRIHDCTSVTTVVENSATLTAGTGYQAEPVQTVSWAGETTPYTQLRRLGGTWYTYEGTGTVVVTAAWGWAAIPDAVTQAAYIGVKEILDAREVRFGIAAVTEFGPTRVRQNPMVAQLLAPYRRVESFGIG